MEKLARKLRAPSVAVDVNGVFRRLTTNKKYAQTLELSPAASYHHLIHTIASARPSPTPPKKDSFCYFPREHGAVSKIVNSSSTCRECVARYLPAAAGPPAFTC